MRSHSSFVLIILATYLFGCTSIKTIQVKATQNGKDAVLHGLPTQVNINYGQNPQLPAEAWTFGGETGVIRSVFQFDLSSIPPKAQILKASLTLYAWGSETGLGKHSPKSGSNEGLLQRVTSNWDENTVTWDTQPTATEANQVLLPPSTSPDQNYIDIDVTNLVQDMKINPEASFGFMLKLKTESKYRALNFCSKEHADPSRHPKLTVEYK